MILQRCFAWSRRARPDEQDGSLWVPAPPVVDLRGGWVNDAVFDRALPALSVVDVRELAVEDNSVAAVADVLGLRR